MSELINREDGLLRLGGNEQIFKTLLRRFVDTPYYEELCVHIANNNLIDAKRGAHAIKGTAGNLGLTALFEIATSLDSALKAGDDFQLIFEDFKIIYEDTVIEIENYITE